MPHGDCARSYPRKNARMKYYISVECAATSPVADLTASLQRAYDQGAAGFFQVLTTSVPSHQVLFERTVADDREYVKNLVANVAGISVAQAAMYQLGAELTEGDVGIVAQPVVEALANGDGKFFDFGAGALEALLEDSIAEAPYWAITGRIPGADEDTCHVMQASIDEEARRSFADKMFAGERDPDQARADAMADVGGDLGVYITSVVSSPVPITEH